MSMNPPRGGIPGGLSSALSEAQSIIAAAEKRAEEVGRASNEALEAAKREGFEQGRLEGRAEAEKTAIRLVGEVGALQEEMAREAARLAIEICRSIFSEELSTNTDRLVQLAREALENSISGATAVVLVTHPEDVAVLERDSDTLRRLSRGASIRIEADPSISRGGCIVRTSFGEVDATVEALLGNLAERLGV